MSTAMRDDEEACATSERNEGERNRTMVDFLECQGQEIVLIRRREDDDERLMTNSIKNCWT